MDLTLSEKRKILATLDEEVKRSIAMTNLPEEYKSAINIKTMKKSEEALIILDLDRNLEDYKGLDDLIIIEPAKFDEEKRKNLLQLCDICPNLKVENVLYNDEESSVKFDSTATEYKEAEEWISEIIDNINSEYTKAQKMAIIDNAIGKKISYAPDFGTEIWNTNDSRALWKAISKGYGVCNGIAKIEQYMLRRVGIESEIVSGKSHAFLKVKDMELQFANGETKTGNTILDPTWNLTGHRFGGIPGNFCISYEEARANDVDGKGIDHHSHDNDEDLQDATLSLDDESLRKLYTSVGLADKDGKFPITDFMQKSKALDEEYANNPEENLKNQFSLLAKRCPEFATCQNSTMTALKDIIFDNDNLKCFDRCVINRVYNKQDEEKRPVVFVYVESEEVGKKFYFADKTEGQFIELPEEEFTKQFECYEKDKENHKGLRLWETLDTEENIDLSKSSGNVVAQEGEER
ncbi:MAG: transglutaminase domain-containing protein [Clostridia bacterium]|nr:transglutaminase domain-containing protein [Clostridia bacterium]